MDFFSPSPTFDDPIGMLRACHRRIERALEVLERVAALEAERGLDDSARLGLRQALHYFATGVPRHSADEEESLFPRLRAALEREPGAAPEVVARLEHQHADLDAAHREVEALAEDLLRTGRFATWERRARFADRLRFLRATYAEHIRVEDEEVFPEAARRVPAGELEAAGAEMAARRGIDWEQQRQVVEGLRSRPWSERT